jgi:hypothetical protein
MEGTTDEETATDIANILQSGDMETDPSAFGPESLGYSFGGPTQLHDEPMADIDVSLVLFDPITSFNFGQCTSTVVQPHQVST